MTRTTGPYPITALRRVAAPLGVREGPAQRALRGRARVAFFACDRGLGWTGDTALECPVVGRPCRSCGTASRSVRRRSMTGTSSCPRPQPIRSATARQPEMSASSRTVENFPTSTASTSAAIASTFAIMVDARLTRLPSLSRTMMPAREVSRLPVSPRRRPTLRGPSRPGLGRLGRSRTREFAPRLEPP
jgi:hypothetical protein